MKSQEQRIEDATAAFLDYTQDWYRDNFDSNKVSEHHWRAVIAHALEAADREPPWPTDESVNAHRAVEPALTDHVPFTITRTRLRAALLADPIIGAAIAYRDENRKRREANGELLDWPEGQSLADAVNGAGL